MAQHANPLHGLARQATPELLQAALHYLMTRYHQRPCRGLALSVVYHLQALMSHPQFRPRQANAEVYPALLKSWLDISRRHAVEAQPQQLH